MNQKERMLSGLLYDSSDPELCQLRLKARRLALQYNLLDEAEETKRQEILKELLPHGAERVFLQPPVHFDYGCNTWFGENISANFNLTVLDCCPIHVGANVMFGPNCTLAAPMHPLRWQERNIRVREDGTLYNWEYAKPIVIEANCWIAAGVTICGGVVIGEGSVIGAGSVVTRDIPPHSLAVGNSCRVIRTITEDDAMELPED